MLMSEHADVRVHCKKLCKEDMYVCPLNRDIYIYIYMWMTFLQHEFEEEVGKSCDRRNLY